MKLMECDGCGESFDSPDGHETGESCNRCDDGIIQVADTPDGEEWFYEED